MRHWINIIGGIGFATLALSVSASPKSDLDAFQNYFRKQFPNVQFQDFSNGVYALDAPSREQWMDIEEFPPYEMAVDEGEKLYKAKFKNGKSLADCFPEGPTVRAKYPYFDEARGEVMTLDLAINECRTANGEAALPYDKGKLASITAYMAYQSRGMPINVDVSSPGAIAAYEEGKKFFYARRGQLNMACAHCHVDNAGKRIRADILSAGVGKVGHFPVYRTAWNEVGTLHWRFQGCNEQVRAKAFPLQGREYRNLEFFLTYMSNGLQLNGPSTRK